MDPMSGYLAKAAIDAILASAEERRPGRRIGQAPRAQRRRRRRDAIAQSWQRRAARGYDVGSLALAAPAPRRPPTVVLTQVLDEAAHHIAERGTGSERGLLEAMSLVAAPSAPGVAAALVDVEGSEASRLRAFGLVHGHLLDVLGPREHAWLLDLLDAADADEADDADDADDVDDTDDTDDTGRAGQVA
jgi:hypothetical protein